MSFQRFGCKCKNAKYFGCRKFLWLRKSLETIVIGHAKTDVSCKLCQIEDFAWWFSVRYQGTHLNRIMIFERVQEQNIVYWTRRGSKKKHLPFWVLLYLTISTVAASITRTTNTRVVIHAIHAFSAIPTRI